MTHATIHGRAAWDCRDAAAGLTLILSFCPGSVTNIASGSTNSSFSQPKAISDCPEVCPLHPLSVMTFRYVWMMFWQCCCVVIKCLNNQGSCGTVQPVHSSLRASLLPAQTWGEKAAVSLQVKCPVRRSSSPALVRCRDVPGALSCQVWEVLTMYFCASWC